MKINKIKAFILWLEKRNLVPETVRIYSWALREYGDRKIDTESIIDFLKENLAKYEPSTLRCYRNAFHAYAKFKKIMVDWEMINKIIPTIQPRFFATIGVEELEKLKGITWRASGGKKDSQRINERNNLMLDFLLYTGIRVGELVNIRLCDYKKGSLKVHGKGNKVRHILIPEFLVKYFQTDSQEYLFKTRNNKKLATTQVRIILNRKTERAGIKKNITPHTFRRSFATLLNNEKCNLTTIQKLLGHSHITTTASYIHNDYDTLYADYSKLWKGNTNYKSRPKLNLV
jgi:site-specific recombinase XerD